MGKVEEFVKTKEKEKHATTEEFIDTLKWYIKSTEELRSDWIKAQSDLNEAFNQKIREINEKMAEQAQEVTA